MGNTQATSASRGTRVSSHLTNEVRLVEEERQLCCDVAIAQRRARRAVVKRLPLDAVAWQQHLGVPRTLREETHQFAFGDVTAVPSQVRYLYESEQRGLQVPGSLDVGVVNAHTDAREHTDACVPIEARLVQHDVLIGCEWGPLFPFACVHRTALC